MMEPMVVVNCRRKYVCKYPLIMNETNFSDFPCHSYSLPFRVSQEVSSPERLCSCLP